MHYIVQMIVSGKVSTPRVFAEQALAQTAFIALVGEHCAATFAEYCSVQGADPEAFATARDFVAARGGEEISFHYWELVPEGMGLEMEAKPAQLPAQSREPILRAAVETQQQVLGVQAELRGLAEKLTTMSQGLVLLQNLFSAEGEGADAAGTAGEPEPATPIAEALDEKYQSAEWHDFVRSLTRMCGGNWGEFPLLSREDWRQAVYGNQTTLQYWEWAAITIDRAIETARTGGYRVEEDGEQEGQYAYLTPGGERSATLYELEDLAWCAAGLHAMGAGDFPA